MSNKKKSSRPEQPIRALSILELGPEDFTQTDLEGRRAIAEKYFSDPDDLHYHASHALDSVEKRVAGELMALLPQALGEDLKEQLFCDGRLLPLEIINYVDMAFFLSRVASVSRAAQRLTGVPASLLIADCEWRSGLGAFPPPQNDYFRTGLAFRSVGASFLEHGVRLATDKTFEPVLLAARRSADWLAVFNRCEFWTEDARLNIATSIQKYALRQCDCRPR